jgi:trans-aconitate 2-methyltransferase
MSDWSANQYLKFEDERTRPPRDLLAQVPLARAERVVVLGCGPGNSTELLLAHYPDAEVIGLDSSPDMLAQARKRLPKCAFIQADLVSWSPTLRTDLLFANASFQWLPDHQGVLRRMLAALPRGGVLAVQMPAMHDTPLRRLPLQIASAGQWAEHLRDVVSAPDILSPAEYWDLLRPHAASLEMWQTTYMHALSGENAVMQWASGSSLRPFLDKLPDTLQGLFRQAYAEASLPHYPRRPDGTTLLPFQRLFIVVRVA